MGSIIDKISKEKFDIAYNNHLPNAWIKFAYKHFSRETEKKNMAVKDIVVCILIGLFLVGFIGAIFNTSTKLIAGAIIPYSILLAALVLYLFSAVFLNNRRIRKIRKELGITKDEYDALVSLYY